MTHRLYYDNSELQEFESVVEEVIPPATGQDRRGLILRETAFYPTSGGQVHDTGWLIVDPHDRVQVMEVAERDDGRVVHYLEAPVDRLVAGATVHGSIDVERRRDHMQQHSGQHVLSAAFVELYEMPTVSFHMGEDYCSIDLATTALSAEQIEAAEMRANQIVLENRAVLVRYVSMEEAEKLGLRKLPPAERDQLRLIEIADFDRSACGGTHVSATGQIGCILLRKTEKVRQGTRVEFVCGSRGVRAARRDYGALSEAAALFSAQLGDVPGQIRKTLDDGRLLRKQRDEALEQLAEAMAAEAIGSSGDRIIGSSGVHVVPADAPTGGSATTERRIVVRTFSDRDIGFVKLFAQKVTRAGVPAIALVASAANPPGLVFAQSAGGAADMGALLKQVLTAVGGRGGGSRDFAQGGVPPGSDVEQLLRQAAGTIGA